MESSFVETDSDSEKWRTARNGGSIKIQTFIVDTPDNLLRDWVKRKNADNKKRREEKLRPNLINERIEDRKNYVAEKDLSPEIIVPNDSSQWTNRKSFKQI
jgi:hypothetical protein